MPFSSSTRGRDKQSEPFAVLQDLVRRDDPTSKDRKYFLRAPAPLHYLERHTGVMSAFFSGDNRLDMGETLMKE